jgi:DNA-damage-inducible protein J
MTTVVSATIDEEIKERADEILKESGLTVSDAVRILLTSVANTGAMPADLLCDTEAHNTWFCGKVNEALNSPHTLIPHEQVMDDIQRIIDSKRY